MFAGKFHLETAFNESRDVINVRCSVNLDKTLSME